jgi:phosphopantothenoylcysteine decarboxylase / phosphopantothenate---cysteine ligase
LGGQKRAGQYLVGFAAETEHVVEHAAAKLAAKRVDLMVANDVAAADSGFEVDTNRAVLLDSSGLVTELPLLSKDALAGVILDHVVRAVSTRRQESQ